jgi:tripartite-type tricarboxylate transporter receptor subunit TctC
VHMMINSIPVLLPHIRSGKLRAIAVGADHRMPVLPGVATMQEAGVTRFNANSWYGLFAPAGTPRDIVTRLNAEAAKALKSKEIRDYLVPQGADPIGNTTDEFLTHIQAELVKWRQAVKDAGIRADG